MKKHIYKIAFTVIWMVLGLWLTIPVDDGREIGDMWLEGGDLLVKTGHSNWYANMDLFALFMIPVVGMWIWTLFKDETKDKPVKRRSRMF